jgi:hypothetical protein
MSDFPNVSPNTLPLHWSTWSAAEELRAITGSGVGASGTWTTANTALYIPVSLPWNYPVKRMWWINGSVAGGNTDVGIYTLGGVRLFSTGSTAESGTSTTQYVSAGTPFVLPAGAYYFAYTHSATTANHIWTSSTGSVANTEAAGILAQASALPLPATASFAVGTTVTSFPYFGITRTTSGF